VSGRGRREYSERASSMTSRTTSSSKSEQTKLLFEQVLVLKLRDTTPFVSYQVTEIEITSLARDWLVIGVLICI
jgi:hypothetical protein